MRAVAEDEGALVTALKAGDESAFALLVERHSPAMLRIARGYVATQEAAEDVVQETWIALLKGIDGFESRSSLRTWLFTILINTAKKRGLRERQTSDAEFAAFTGATVEAVRFRGSDDRWPGHWRADATPAPFPETPEGSVLAGEMLSVARRELDRLPDRQRTVVTLRDVYGFESREVTELLDITVANQRVLLHRGRAAVRQALEAYLSEES
ncbi:sigma-70 family RNA polymerase sigma factor [Mycobacterium sp. 852002-51961_SCH5331710]|uniref:RNA polymerase sigma factor n=1 Tax=Mycobacterium sp. 852002-51961_SCH5331710 TaxID=1834105 RepID=UPI000802547F|nr:sigma-70 family RNA polymerase sigma factor [Mycobacterium sp. 852002-51961_SCH5331710]OBB36371.1 RNA polymerase subunit sigma-24 [Mycobacterium sp. 852002-51961_SCH5331710]